MVLFGHVVESVHRRQRLPMSALLGVLKPHMEKSICILGESERWPEWSDLPNNVCANLMAQVQSAFAVPEMLLEEYTHRLYDVAIALQEAVRSGDFLIRVPVPDHLGNLG